MKRWRAPAAAVPFGAAEPAVPTAPAAPVPEPGGAQRIEAPGSDGEGDIGPHRTSAWPLALIYVALVVYASLYPFTGWRNQGIAPWAFLFAPWPRYWTGFDLAINAAGYAPAGFLLALSALRSGRPARARHAVALATAAAAALSLAMEMAQSYLPSRVPWNVDFALNVAGAFAGAAVAWLLERLGAVARWSRLRARWFVDDARGALVLLALWPVALLFPAAVPFGLGQVLERLEAQMANFLEDTPFLEWLPVRDVELQPLVPGAELLCVMLGALVPCLLAYSVIRPAAQRAFFAIAMLAAGLAATALSAAMSYGPEHALAWFELPAQVGVAAALMATLLLVKAPRRACAAVLLLTLTVHLALLNDAPTNAYFAETLQAWEQGRFIRFNGLGQWLGWVWPYATLAYVLARLSMRRGPPR